MGNLTQETFYPKAGTVLIPKPEYAHKFRNWKEHVVTEKEEEGNGTIGDYWMVKPDVKN